MYQWVTRDVFWNPGIIVGNAYAPFFRVNSVFWDPSIYGRYLAVAILVTLAGIVLGGVRGLRSVGLYLVVVAIWIGLAFSYSQSSFDRALRRRRRLGRRRLGPPRGGRTRGARRARASSSALRRRRCATRSRASRAAA